jgi:hypothetical protein
MSDSADDEDAGGPPGAKDPRVADDGADDTAPGPGPTRPDPDAHPDVAGAIRNFAQSYATAAAKGGSTPEMTDAVTQALVMILGSGPSLAALDGFMAVQQSNGIMYHNAVANQQKTNLLGMAMTAKCVRYMLDGDSVEFDDAIISEMTA